MTRVSAVNSLSGRFLLLGVIPAMLTIGAIVALGAVEEYRDLRKIEEMVLAASVGGAASELNIRNDRWNNVVTVMSLAQSNGLFGQRKATSELAKSVAGTLPLIIGAFFVYEPDADGQDAAAIKGVDLPREAMDAGGRFLPYWYFDPAQGGAIRLKPNTGMETMEYYQAPRNGFAGTGKAAAVVTEPYVYEGVEMVSHTCPIAVRGKFMGIAGVDRGIETLANIAGDIKTRTGADVFVLSAGGRFIAATADDRLRMREISETPYAAMALGGNGRRGLRVAGP